MNKFELNQLDVRKDGRVILYQRPRKDGSVIPTWQMRISVPNATGYKRSSTGEKKQSEAVRVALNAYEELYMKVLSGGSVQSKTFNEVYKEWKVDLPRMMVGRGKAENYCSSRISLVKNYPLVFFKNKKIDSIRKQDFIDYRIWRNENSARFNPSTKKSTPYIPSNNTLRKESVAIKMVFEYAVDKGWCTSIPAMDKPSLSKNRRPTFTLTEWRKLTRKIDSWVREGNRYGHAGRDRFLLKQYILILANCGVRIGEMRSLRWSDLETKILDDGTTRLVAIVTGKTGQRQVVFNAGADEFVKRIYDMRKKELMEEPSKDGFVICKRDGSTIDSLKGGFASLLRFCDLELTSKGERRTLYSLRHFYATRRLSEEVSPYLLASNMGTSVEMLHRHYGQIVNDLVAKEITKTKNQKKSPKTKTGEYPFEVLK